MGVMSRLGRVEGMKEQRVPCRKGDGCLPEDGKLPVANLSPVGSVLTP